MSKYSSFRQPLPPKSYEPHPIWRGIGCVIMLILPVVSYAISMLAVEYAIQQGIRMPDGFGGAPALPEILFKAPGLVSILLWIQQQDNLYANLIVALFILVVLAAIFVLFYSIMYRVSGPSKYSAFDAPPPNVKVKKYRR